MTIELKVPSVGESITEVQIGRWMYAPGDEIEQDEDVVEIDSEKATVALPAPARGVLREVLKQTGETAEVGEVIGYMDKDGEGKSETSKKPKETSEQEERQKKDADKGAKDKAPKRDEAKRGRAEWEADEKRDEVHVMPAARRLLKQHDLSPDDVKATGPKGRLTKQDVMRHVEEQEAQDKQDKDEAKQEKKERRAKDAEAGSDEDSVVPMTPIRRAIARRLVEAQHNAALLTTFNEVDMSAVLELRKTVQDEFVAKHEVKLGFMSFFIKAVVDALSNIPQLNSEIRDDSIVYHKHCDIGVAVSSNKGLVVPVLRRAESMSFGQIEKTIVQFAKQAKANRLSPDDLQGGTFTISNGGVFGSLLSTPIINPPQSGVLGMHAIQDRPVAVDGQVVIRPMMYIALTYDHRVVDGREAVTFLRRVRECVEHPARMLLGA